ncbi:MAG: hypothetical protein IJK28_02060 [Clostridia bacterium]|nr:hypothetical protein [Clostridia bacterium]
MFKHPAKKLKWTSYIVSLLCVAGGAFYGYLRFRNKQTLIAAAVVAAALVLAWVLGLIVYGFGELIEKTKDNNYLLARVASHTKELESMKRN